MSIAGYLSAGKTELRMPKESVDALGIRFEGAVTTGARTVEEQLLRDAVRVNMPEDVCYENVEDYDPVLRSHCRLPVLG